MTIDAIEEAPLYWQRLGLHNGRCTIPTLNMLRLRGEKRLRRIHVRIIGNVGTCFVTIRGLRYIVPDYPAPGDTLRPWVEWNHAHSRLAKALKDEPC